MKEKNILLIAALSLIIAFVVLAFREAFLADPMNSNWWSISFTAQNPKDGSFTVSNFGTTKTFFYEVRINDVTVKSASFTGENGSSQTILVQNLEEKPINASVWTEGDTNKASKDLTKKKYIYKR